MFLRCTTRKKNGKEHRYWNLVENQRVAGGQVVQRQVLYLGEINDSQREVWRKSIEVFEDGRSAPRMVALFAEDQTTTSKSTSPAQRLSPTSSFFGSRLDFMRVGGAHEARSKRRGGFTLAVYRAGW